MKATIILLLLGCFLNNATQAQLQARQALHVGLEQDLLPYATGGYFGGIWIGKDHWRIRAITARVHKPDFLIAKGFTNNRVTAYALLGDYFLRSDWRGWYAGSGLVYWNSTIQSAQQLSTAKYENLLLNGSIGYNIPLFSNFYISPWAGMHVRIGGAREVIVDGQTFNPPLVNPEASIKVGWWF